MELTNLLSLDHPYSTKDVQQWLEYLTTVIPCAVRMAAIDANWGRIMNSRTFLDFNLASVQGGPITGIYLFSKRYDLVEEWSKSERKMLKEILRTYEQYKK